MIKDNSKFQKHGTLFVTWLHFLFFNLSSKPHGCPLKEADLETVKVVNFATKWLNLYPHTVLRFNLEIISIPANQAKGGGGGEGGSDSGWKMSFHDRGPQMAVTPDGLKTQSRHPKVDHVSKNYLGTSG